VSLSDESEESLGGAKEDKDERGILAGADEETAFDVVEEEEDEVIIEIWDQKMTKKKTQKQMKLESMAGECLEERANTAKNPEKETVKQGYTI